MSLRFDGFDGGGDVRESLSLAFSEGRMPHAVILEGEPGSGTDRLAAVLAKAAVCLSGGDKPCGQCAGCIKAQAGSHPDILTLNGDENPRAFPVDAIRQIRSDAFIRPNEAPHKVFVLLGVQNMSEISQNALLKILEEPPENVLFVLTTVSAAALLPTVRSRAQLFSVAGGSLPGDWTLANQIARSVMASGEADLLFGTAGLIKDKEGLRGVLKQLLLLFRDALVVRSGGTSCLSGQQETAAALGGGLTRLSLVRMIDQTEKALRALDQNANTALLVTAYCAWLRCAAGR
ncbi:MAG TPA: ATP-binding protein [Caproicibacter sp.]|nr:ATP-binding protein [Caproicibacter sp.]